MKGQNGKQQPEEMTKYNLRSSGRQLPKEPIKIGFVTFKPEITRRQIESIVKQREDKLLNEDLMRIIGSYYSKDKLIKLFNMAESIEIRQLEITRTKLPNFLLTISHIQFDNMIYLQLSNCNIGNIEPLSYLNAGNLSTLMIPQNCITSFKSINKLNIPTLTGLFIGNNQAQSFDISRTRFTRPFNHVQLILRPSMNKIVQNLNFIAKLQRTFQLQNFQRYQNYYNFVIVETMTINGITETKFINKTIPQRIVTNALKRNMRRKQ